MIIVQMFTTGSPDFLLMAQKSAVLWCLPSAWRLGFLVSKFLAKIWAIILGKARRFCEIFQDRSFFSDFDWHDLGFLGKILLFLGFIGKNNCQDLGKKSKKSKILARNEKNPRSWQKIQNYPRLSKILARKPIRQALGIYLEKKV